MAGVERGEVLWGPLDSPTQAGRFLDHVRSNIDSKVTDYASLHAWSVTEPARFWGLVSSWFDVTWHTKPREVMMATTEMIGTTWWPGGELNFAERVFEMAAGHEDEVAIIAYSDSRPSVELTWRRLLSLVSHYQDVLTGHGVRTGDRVVAFLPNIPETIAIFLACAATGVAFSSCPPEFGEDAVISRFSQIEPVLLFFVDRYRYGSRDFDKSEIVGRIAAALPKLRAVERIEMSSIDEMIEHSSSDQEPEVVAVPSEHPLYILYSSGTTGLPKPIIHGHAGIIHEHVKIMALHHDLARGDRFLWYTTTGWVMWNYLVSALLVGSTIVTYDGDPTYPDISRLWEVAADEQLTMLGLGANFINNCMKSGIEPGKNFDLARLRIVGSTGSPLAADGFRWVKSSVSERAIVHSICGGTDVGSAFLGMSPLTPVRAGEMSCPLLGADVRAFNEDGSRASPGVTGELVISTPMPSMPVGLWNDPDGSRLRATYFEDFPGNWRHGDWITFHPDGAAVVSGRSDATLNRGGVRLGTAEFYGVVEALSFVVDSLVVHLAAPGEEQGQLLLFVQTDGRALGEAERSEINSVLRARLSPRHVPDQTVVVRKIPRTLSGKKLEIPVKKILLGAEPSKVCSLDSLVDASALDDFVAMRDRGYPVDQR